MYLLEPDHLKQLTLSLPLAQQLAELRHQQALTYNHQNYSTDLLAGMAIKSKQAAVSAINKDKPSAFDYQASLQYQNPQQKLNTDYIRSLHQILNSHGGNWRAVKPPSSSQFPAKTKVVEVATAMEQIVTLYNAASEQRTEPLIIIPFLLRDLFCIFPFIDGNRRIMLLLARQLLIQAKHPVIQYIDIESELIATEKAFYRSLDQAAQTPANNQAWLMYWWVLIGRIYQRFNKQLTRSNITSGRGSKTALIEHFVQQQQGAFTLQNICSAFPTISKDMVRVVLRQLRGEGIISSSGRGRNAFWKNN